MSLIAKQKRRRLTRQLNVRVSSDVLDQLAAYCRFIDSCRNYVVEEALTRTFRADREFREWRHGQGSTRKNDIDSAREDA